MHRLLAFLIPCMLLFSCSNNPVDQKGTAGNQAKGKIVVVCTSASTGTSKIAATERADIWIWKTLDVAPVVYALTKESGTTTFTGEFEVDAGTYARVTVKGYANDTSDPNTNTVTYFGSTLNVNVTPLPAETTVTIGLMPLGTVTSVSGIEFVSIPDGTFKMGIVGSGTAAPAHDVTLSGFMIGAKEVTNAQYAAFLNAALASGDIEVKSGRYPYGKTGPWAGEKYLNTGAGTPPVNYNECLVVYGSGVFSVVSGYENYPVVYMSWYGAKAFAAYYGFDLPTEAEWEYTCRGGKQYEYGTDDGTISGSKANYNYGVGYLKFTANVGSYPDNPYGVYDMSGNVEEWCHDLYASYSAAAQVNPVGSSTDTDRVLRGGNFLDGANACKSTARGNREQSGYSYASGFRVVKRASPQMY